MSTIESLGIGKRVHRNFHGSSAQLLVTATSASPSRRSRPPCRRASPVVNTILLGLATGLP